jgi:hypothetical protein
MSRWGVHSFYRGWLTDRGRRWTGTEAQARLKAAGFSEDLFYQAIPLPLPKRPDSERGARFEDLVGIELRCCGREMECVGNLSLRGPAVNTSLGYECKKCYRRVMVVDEWLKTDSSLQDVEP